MNEPENEERKINSLLVGVVVEVPLDSDVDIETKEGVQMIANSKEISDLISSLVSGALSHNYETGSDLKIWASRVISSVEGLWEEYNG